MTYSVLKVPLNPNQPTNLDWNVQCGACGLSLLRPATLFRL